MLLPPGRACTPARMEEYAVLITRVPNRLHTEAFKERGQQVCLVTGDNVDPLIPAARKVSIACSRTSDDLESGKRGLNKPIREE